MTQSAMIDRTKLQKKLQKAADHAQARIAAAQKLLEKPNIDIEDLQGITRVLDQVMRISPSQPVATFECVG